MSIYISASINYFSSKPLTKNIKNYKSKQYLIFINCCYDIQSDRISSVLALFVVIVDELSRFLTSKNTKC